MIKDGDLPELDSYRRLERVLPIESLSEYGPLVVSRDNDSAPIHRWFRYKEAYSEGLLPKILSTLKPRCGTRQSLLDPYCGVGTTLLSAQILSNQVENALGLERNPFSAFVARSKLSWPEIDTEELERIATLVLQGPADAGGPLPELSSIRSGRCISRHIAGRLLHIRDRIQCFPESPARSALLVGLASAIEPLSRVRKDGRALRLVERTCQPVAPVLREKWGEILCDVQEMQRLYKTVTGTAVREADGRRLREAGIGNSTVDLIVTSPPYPNNIDYSEVYKLELWILGFVKNNHEFLNLRKSTMRSHPTSDLDSAIDSEFLAAADAAPLGPIFQPIIRGAAAFGEPWRTKLVLGYFSDLWNSLREQYACLRPGGHVFMVVGNSLHGHAGRAYLIPTDLLLSQLAVRLGFELKRILIARNTRRRLSGNHFLRESIVMLRKPHA